MGSNPTPSALEQAFCAARGIPTRGTGPWPARVPGGRHGPDGGQDIEWAWSRKLLLKSLRPTGRAERTPRPGRSTDHLPDNPAGRQCGSQTAPDPGQRSPRITGHVRAARTWHMRCHEIRRGDRSRGADRTTQRCWARRSLRTGYGSRRPVRRGAARGPGSWGGRRSALRAPGCS